MAIIDLPPFSWLIWFVLVIIPIRALYRLTLHPLAVFPGPKLAAITRLWAASHDVLGNSDDSLIKHLKDLHDQYGPIVRVRPDELHIFDWDAYHRVFKQNTDFDKFPSLYSHPLLENSFLNKTKVKVAQPHRNLYINAFSKARVRDLAPLMHQKQMLFFEKLSQAAREETIIELDYGFNCLTADVTMGYCYQMDLGLLNAPNFRHILVMDLHELSAANPVFWYIPDTITWAINGLIFKVLSYKMVKRISPPVAAMQQVLGKCASLVSSLAKADPQSKEVMDSMFRTALNPDTDKGQYRPSEKELTGDAVLMFTAGTHTTAHALTTGTWNMIKKPEIWKCARSEIATLIKVDGTATNQELERLPYLNGIVKECLRLSLGASVRLPRVVPKGGVILAGKHIPEGTSVAFSHYVYNNDPTLFPNPQEFRPERWIGEKSQVDRMEAHMISFSRGSRNCIGMNLAMAELYTILAHLIRRFDLVNAGTTAYDMDFRDCFIPRSNGHLKVRVKLAE